MSDYTPTTEEVREAIAEWTWSRRMFRPELAQSDGREFDRWCAEWAAEQGETEALTEKDLYELPNLSMVLRSWPNSPLPDAPEVYRKRGGWWIDLTDRSDDYEQTTGVIWSEVARFTVIHIPAPGTTNNESEGKA